VVERAIRPLALNRKNALFAGSDGGAKQLRNRRAASQREQLLVHRVEQPSKRGREEYEPVFGRQLTMPAA